MQQLKSGCGILHALTLRHRSGCHRVIVGDRQQGSKGALQELEHEERAAVLGLPLHHHLGNAGDAGVQVAQVHDLGRDIVLSGLVVAVLVLEQLDDGLVAVLEPHEKGVGKLTGSEPARDFELREQDLRHGAGLQTW